MRAIALTLLVLNIAAVKAVDNEPLYKAIAVIGGGKGNVKGNVTFIQQNCNDPVQVIVLVEGLTDGKHGFHIHEKGDLSNGCASMAGHYNPDNVDHAAPDAATRHAGDLGNIESLNGVVNYVFNDSIIQLHGSRSIIGRGVVIHEGEDDLGLTDHPDSKKTGNAGGRAGCGVIGIIIPSDESHCDSGSNYIYPTNILITSTLTILILINFR